MAGFFDCSTRFTAVKVVELWTTIAKKSFSWYVKEKFSLTI